MYHERQYNFELFQLRIILQCNQDNIAVVRPVYPFPKIELFGVVVEGEIFGTSPMSRYARCAGVLPGGRCLSRSSRSVTDNFETGLTGELRMVLTG
jgi:hypothetical protein